MVWFCLLINLHPLSWSLFVTLISLDCCFLQPLCISLKFTVLNVFLSSMTEDGESGKDLQCEFCGEHKWTRRGWSTYEECKIFLFLNTNLNWWILCSMIGLGCSFPELIWMYWLQLLTVILLDFFFQGTLLFPSLKVPWYTILSAISSLNWVHWHHKQMFLLQYLGFLCDVWISSDFNSITLIL